MDEARLAAELAAFPPAMAAQLDERFRTSPLAYHNADHIEHMLDGLDRWFAPRLGARDLRVLRHAIWLHDYIYDVTRHDNEERSAASADESTLGLPDDELRDIRSCILATKGHATEQPLAQILVELDLMILAERRDRYRRYALAIRAEYRIYPDDAYRAGRIKVLDHLCAAPLLRRLAHAQGLDEAALETRARANMRWEQDRLRQQGAIDAVLMG